MKTAIKLERSLTPKDNITQNSDFVELTPITANHKMEGCKGEMCGLTRHYAL